MTEQARNPNGEFASGGHTAEQATREAGRYPVRAHVNLKAPGSRTGKNVAGNLAKALLGVALGAASVIGRSALRSQPRGGRR
jgi:hypothetical protein